MIHRGEYKVSAGGPCVLQIHAPFTCFAFAQLCLTGLCPVATLVSEALSAGFVDAASTAIPAHSEAKATPALETCSASVQLLTDSQRARRNRLPAKNAGQQRVPWVRHRQEAEAGQGAGPSGTALHAVREGPDFPRLARLAGDCPIRPMRGLLPERRDGGWRRRRIRSWLLWQTPNILNKPRAKP
jgi:hypothetical protein